MMEEDGDDDGAIAGLCACVVVVMATVMVRSSESILKVLAMASAVFFAAASFSPQVMEEPKQLSIPNSSEHVKFDRNSEELSMGYQNEI
ncbi:uncharacterized protein A4U43_C09F11400 [Asparagus officinalis]|uniref:Uncharacterized protein n=1 Tax=Asparagus officinalis TaxID=4686 RepID=A0A5P1EA15_ASPOF|nr:uncharacterized protein A4U43_C09F11400 [Asparagus officinalis]